MIDYSKSKLPKGPTRAALKMARDRLRETLDRAESAKVRVRSGGQCEVWVTDQRCRHRASEVHHLLGGIGRRGRGESCLARCKLHVCRTCHRLITSHRLQRIGSAMPHWADRYRRVA